MCKQGVNSLSAITYWVIGSNVVDLDLQYCILGGPSTAIVIIGHAVILCRSFMQLHACLGESYSYNYITL